MAYQEQPTTATNHRHKVMSIMNRVKAIKLHYLNSFIEMHPEYDSEYGRARVRNVINLRVYDREIIVKLEAFANKLEAESVSTAQTNK